MVSGALMRSNERTSHSGSATASQCTPALPPSRAGFQEGAEAGFEWGAIRAAAKTLEILCGQVPGTSQIQDQVRAATAPLCLSSAFMRARTRTHAHRAGTRTRPAAHDSPASYAS